jgi:transposase-like protein
MPKWYVYTALLGGEKGLAEKTTKRAILGTNRAPSPLQPSVVDRPQYRIADEIRNAIAAEPPEVKARELAIRFHISAASVINIRRAAGVEIFPQPRGPGRALGATYKTEKREKAKALILEGKSVREVAKEAGISTNTVRLAKQEIPADVLPPPLIGGFHAHKASKEFQHSLQGETMPAPPLPRSTSMAPHPLVGALVTMMPPPENGWKPTDRKKWMAALESTIDLIYEASE